MPIYEFRCQDCGKSHELFYRMNDEKAPPICCGKSTYRIYNFQVNADLLYQGVVRSLDSKPIEIYSKRQWKRELKERGLTDDFDNIMTCAKPQNEVGNQSQMKKVRRKVAEQAVHEARKDLRL